MKSTIKKILIPIIIFHIVGDMVNKAGNYINSDKVNIPSSESPYVLPNNGGKLNSSIHFYKYDLGWSNITGRKGDFN